MLLCVYRQRRYWTEARRVSETEGVALNQFINVAVAEKLSALRTEDYFRERAERGDVASKANSKTCGTRNASCALAMKWTESGSAMQYRFRNAR